MSFKSIILDLAIALHADRRADLRGQTVVGRWLGYRDADLACSLAVPPATHEFKYSLFYARPGELVVLFDNERGKGDHSHIGEVEGRYCFETPEKLIDDFKAAVRAARKEGR
jgi:hypothetical protein